MFRNLLTTGMGHTTIISGLIAFILPIVMIHIKEMVRNEKAWRLLKTALFFLYIFGMIYLTLGERSSNGERNVNLTPFWTYSLFFEPQYRWEIYMNVFLFLPFGFMMGFIVKQDILHSMLAGFFFSLCIELTQFIFCLGLCELDDVFHNTLGTVQGYGYWKALSWLETKHGREIWAVEHRAILYVKKLGARLLVLIKSILERGRKT